MKLASFKHKGQSSYGIVDGAIIRDIGAAMGARAPTLKDLLASEGLDDANLAAASPPPLPLSEIDFEPVVPNPGKILCVGINYATHIAEAGLPTPEKPMIFVRYPDSQVGHKQPMICPRESSQFDFEGELAVIIGKRGRRIPTSEAFDHVAGYSCYNDGSIRDWQFHTTQFTPGKTFPGTGGFGPWLVTTDEIPDPATLSIETRLNGAMMQKAPISDLVFNVPQLIAYCSAFTILNPGDVIITGTTGGVGAFRNPQVWLKPGDTIEVDISSVGVLSNTIVAEPDD
ncbi:2-keto-4-pentenoate hydratase/2-oxohepta-3-ene-1,7-dioic acid hydratase in catechol pathway [Bradyrhizobium macuxiense]|uniref:2-keto-4-pentenoate hydratase/2-oxohepta-3-ene-1,7-dioic acid hydratase in catechol pathway n=1 Tax=Bradyrhizobium macuxiense TaxID=1755647 RepID=A0A560L3L6_9BRAD|nr:fumarylacetoacetate hydrolase family protein [Bradyrhizobium macuxiense]TWB87750.1 2-keto-4-pentenoate hydratase/2-oxohepta-3-ene-1,7-dioic acid hydratase in catechol pathway [Bradyrhizobium macuxiense]